jgi:ketosteroid isomerase-like protein
MKPHCVALLLLVVAALSGCPSARPPASPPEVRNDALRADLEKATTAFHEALRTNDTDKLLVHVADDVIMMPPNETPVRGKAAMRTWYGGFLSAFKTTRLILGDREVALGDGWASELGEYEWELQPAGGGEPVIDKGNYMQIWKRQPDGRWLFQREIWNSAIPLATPAAK